MPPNDSSYPIRLWCKVFEDFRQVEHVLVVSASEGGGWLGRLDITIRGRKDILHARAEELDDTLYKFKSNPREVATSFLKKYGVLVYYQDTHVAFFDILAYSSFINSKPMEECISELDNLLATINNRVIADIGLLKLDHWILSDSIILVVDTNRSPLHYHSLQALIIACSQIMETGMKHGLPMRGAIGGGDFYKDGELMVSSALVDAARYEKEQNWLGAVFTPKALQIVDKAMEYEAKHEEERLIDLSRDNFKRYLRYGKIPWKPGGVIEKPEESYYIKPFRMNEKDWAEKYIPGYFDNPEKIKNSNCLYAQE